MTIGEIPPTEMVGRLARGLNFTIGPFSIRLQTAPMRAFGEQLQLLYADHPLTEDEQFADFHVALCRVGGWRRWWKPQVQFDTDGERPFAPFPWDSALPVWEWSLNWCVANRAHQYLMLHAGVVAKGNRALLLPAKPGSGKSTLCAALSQRGWRLLSDEFALVDPDSGDILPFPRPISLKNESIDVIRRFAPGAVIGPKFPNTRKGTVAHVSPGSASMRAAQQSARPSWIVFPQYQADTPATLEPHPKDQSFLKLSSNSFNYELIGLRGFEAAAQLIEGSASYRFRYGNLQEAIGVFEALADQPVGTG